MLRNHVDALDDNSLLADIHGKNLAFFIFILAGDNPDGITLLDF
jgi:hypothetical protein